MDQARERAPTKGIYIRLKPALASSLEVAARTDRLSPTGWARRAIAEALPDSEMASLALPPSPPRRPLVMPSDDLATVARLAGGTARCTGAVIQLAKSLRETAHPAHGELEDVLRDLRAVQRELVSVVALLRPRLNA